MIRVLIIEDEPVIARNLKKMVMEADPAIQVEAVLGTVSASVEWLDHHPQPDLIFSDIQLADGISFEIFEKNAITCPVIFITAYDEYAIRAFRLNSVHYLLKPIDKPDLAAAIEKYRNIYASKMVYQDQMAGLIEDLRHPAEKKYKTRFMAHYMRSLVPVAENSVLCFRKDQLIYLLTNDGEELVTDYHSLDELEELLDPRRFFRANRQHIIHIESVKGFKVTASVKIVVTLKNTASTQVLVSREKAPFFRNWVG